VRAANSETRAERLADRIDANVAAASTNVPAAVASEAQVDQSVMLPQLSETLAGGVRPQAVRLSETGSHD
jgi:hypothetical protein